jgi:hypothetical protein
VLGASAPLDVKLRDCEMVAKFSRAEVLALLQAMGGMVQMTAGGQLTGHGTFAGTDWVVVK